MNKSMNKSIEERLELIEHERFDGFFDVTVAQFTAGRRAGVAYKRTAYDALMERGVINDPVIRKAAITLLVARRSDLPARERDMLAYLTSITIAKLLEWSDRTTLASEAAK